MTFAAPLHAAKREKFWMTIVKAGALDAAYATYDYVPDLAGSMTLKAPLTAGDYEVRLHASYPRLSRNLVHEIVIHIR